MKWFTWEVCSVEMEDTRWMDVGRRIAAGDKVNGALAALINSQMSTAARLAVHYAVFGTDTVT